MALADKPLDSPSGIGGAFVVIAGAPLAEAVQRRRSHLVGQRPVGERGRVLQVGDPPVDAVTRIRHRGDEMGRPRAFCQSGQGLIEHAPSPGFPAGEDGGIGKSEVDPGDLKGGFGNRVGLSQAALQARLLQKLGVVKEKQAGHGTSAPRLKWRANQPPISSRVAGSRR